MFHLQSLGPAYLPRSWCLVPGGAAPFHRAVHMELHRLVMQPWSAVVQRVPRR